MNPTSGVPILEGVGQDCVVGTMGDVNYTALRAPAALGRQSTRWKSTALSTSPPTTASPAAVCWCRLPPR